MAYAYPELYECSSAKFYATSNTNLLLMHEIKNIQLILILIIH